MARHADPVVPAGPGQMLHPPPIDPSARFQPVGDDRVDMRCVQTPGLRVVGPEVGDIGELPLAGGVVHEGEEMDQPAADQALHLGEGLVVGDLVAGMDVGAGAEAAFQLMDLADQKIGHLRAAKRRVLVAVQKTEAVVDGGDPAGRKLLVQFVEGHVHREAAARPGLNGVFDHIAVDVDKSGQQQTAAAVDGAGAGEGPGGDLLDHPVRHCHRRLRKHCTRRDHPHVADQDLGDDSVVGCHRGASFLVRSHVSSLDRAWGTHHP